MSETGSIVFGLRIEEDDLKPQDILDDIADRLEDDGFDEDDWDFLAWELHGIVYVVMYGPLLVRASLLRIDYIERVEPVLEATATIRSNKSRWLYPSRKVKGTPIIETATSKLDKWIASQFPQEQDEQKTIEKILAASDSSAAPPRPIRKRGEKGARIPAGVGAVNNLLDVISQGKSEDGEGFDVFSFNDSAPTEE